MSDSDSTDAEHRLQLWFSKFSPLAIILPPLAVLLFAWMLERTPDRAAFEQRAIRIVFEPVEIGGRGVAPLRVAGAWAVSSPDPGFGGVSALAIERGGLLALGDSGRLVRIPRPAAGDSVAPIEDLPAGPGSSQFKHNRDSEALLRDPAGRGWWVTFEHRHELWLYGPRFDRALRRFVLPADDWSENAGIEAMAADGNDLLLFPETADWAIRIADRKAATIPLAGLGMRISDAANLPDGRILLLERGLTARGFASALVLLERDGPGYRAAARMRLPLGPLDNAEALAAELGPNGSVRLWLMTDDNFQRPLRTLLVAFELPGQVRSSR